MLVTTGRTKRSKFGWLLYEAIRSYDGLVVWFSVPSNEED